MLVFVTMRSKEELTSSLVWPTLVKWMAGGIPVSGPMPPRLEKLRDARLMWISPSRSRHIGEGGVGGGAGEGGEGGGGDGEGGGGDGEGDGGGGEGGNGGGHGVGGGGDGDGGGVGGGGCAGGAQRPSQSTAYSALTIVPATEPT